jgi:hypothetical protein
VVQPEQPGQRSQHPGVIVGEQYSWTHYVRRA